MASTHIAFDGSATRFASKVRSDIDMLTALVSAVEEHKAVMDSMKAGDDWVNLGAQLGISAANAQTVYNLFTPIKTLLSTNADVASIISRCG